MLLTFAMSIDGNIAARNGESRYISESGSLALAQELRRTHAAILVGIGTVIEDDPLLTSRSQPGTDPLRIIIDSRLRLPTESRICSTAAEVSTLVFTAKENLHTPRADQLRQAGIELCACRRTETGLDLAEILDELNRRGIESLMVEGGARILSSFLSRKLWDRMLVVSAPLFLGAGIGPFHAVGIEKLAQGVRPSVEEIRIIGNEVVWDLRPSKAAN